MNDLINHRFVKENKNNPTWHERTFYKCLKYINPWKILNKRFDSNCFQYPFRHQRGFYIADFYIDFLKLIFEIDGEIHWKSEQVDYDIKRKQFFEHQGIKVISIPNSSLARWNAKKRNEIRTIIYTRAAEIYPTKTIANLNRKFIGCLVYHSCTNSYHVFDGIKKLPSQLSTFKKANGERIKYALAMVDFSENR